MDRNALARAYRNIAVTYIQLAEVLEGAEPVDGPQDAPGRPETPPAPQLPDRPFAPVVGVPTASTMPAQPLPSNAADPMRCPAHGVPYRVGRRGYFCSSTAAEPAWADRKGYCSITPETAAQYVQIHAAR